MATDQAPAKPVTTRETFRTTGETFRSAAVHVCVLQVATDRDEGQADTLTERERRGC